MAGVVRRQTSNPQPKEGGVMIALPFYSANNRYLSGTQFGADFPYFRRDLISHLSAIQHVRGRYKADTRSRPDDT